MIDRALEILGLALKNILRNKLRSFLTMLGMIFGVGSVIAMLAVGAGARHEIIERIQQLGVTNIIVNSIRPPDEAKPDSNERRQIDRYGLKFDDADYLGATVPTIDRLFRVNRVGQRVWYGSRRLGAAVLGVEPAYMDLLHLDVGRGRKISALDAERNAKVCVIRRGLVRQLETVVDPVGEWLKIGRHSFQIIGVLENDSFQSHARKALALDGRALEVYIPYSTSMRSYGTITNLEKKGGSERTEVELDQIIVSVGDVDSVFDSARMIDSVLTRFHDRRDFEVVVPLALLQQSEETRKVFSIVMVLIAAISLLVGGIGIANIMLATITERTREIGVRRAMGARRRDIMVQFLVETTAIAGVGGLLGCAFAVGGILAIVAYTDWKAIISPEYVVVSLLISCGVGIAFGIFPARRAAQMDPIGALRSE